MIRKFYFVITATILLVGCKNKSGIVDDTSIIVSNSLEEDIFWGKLAEISNGTLLDLNCDGHNDSISIEVWTESERYQHYKLIINDVSIEGSYEVFNPDYKIQTMMYAIQLDHEKGSIQVLIPEPEQLAGADSKTAIYSYTEGVIICLGRISALPEELNFVKSNDNSILIKTKKQSMLIGSWYHEQEYCFIWEINKEASGGKVPVLKEVVQDMYYTDWEIKVTMLKDLPIYSSKESEETSIVFNEGEEIIFLASDDIKWVYAQSVTYPEKIGYILADTSYVPINGELFYVSDVFDGNYLAD